MPKQHFEKVLSVFSILSPPIVLVFSQYLEHFFSDWARNPIKFLRGCNVKALTKFHLVWATFSSRHDMKPEARIAVRDSESILHWLAVTVIERCAKACSWAQRDSAHWPAIDQAQDSPWWKIWTERSHRCFGCFFYLFGWQTCIQHGLFSPWFWTLIITLLLCQQTMARVVL